MDEIERIRRAAAGDLEAFEALVESRRERVVRIAWHIVGDRELARDVAQDAFVRLYRVIGRFREGGRFDTWLHRIVVNLSIDALRRERSHRETLLLDDGTRSPAGGAAGPEGAEDARGGGARTARPAAPGGPAEAQRAAEVRRIFLELSALLPPKQRAAFVLREIENLTTEEVAAALRMRASTVRNHVLQARRVLREELRRRYPEYCRPSG